MYIAGHIAEVTGLSPDTTEKEVMEFFSYCGEIEHLEIIRLSEDTYNAFIMFKDAHALEKATLLSGSTIANRCMSIAALKTELDELDPGSDDTPKTKDESTSEVRSASPGDIMAMEEVVTTMLSKGFELSRDALRKAKEFDESYQVSSIAAAKAMDLSKRIGLTDKINSGVETAKSIDEKYNVSGITTSVASFTGRAAIATANVVMNSRSFGNGATWVSGVLDRASKAAADFANKGTRE